MPWLVDVGDPFSFETAIPPNNRCLYEDINRTVERKVFAVADCVAVTTAETQNRYAELFPESKSKIVVIPPLLSLCAMPSNTSHVGDQVIRLTFLGTLYRTIREPDALLNLFSTLLETAIGSRLELHFFGNIGDCAARFEPYRDWIGRRIFVHGVIDRARIEEVLGTASVLVNIGNATSYQLPSKVVEYAFSGKPVLNIITHDNDSSARFFAQYPAVLTLNLASPDWRAQLGRVVTFISHPPAADPAAIARLLKPYQIEAIASAYADALRGSINNRRKPEDTLAAALY